MLSFMFFRLYCLQEVHLQRAANADGDVRVLAPVTLSSFLEASLTAQRALAGRRPRRQQQQQRLDQRGGSSTSSGADGTQQQQQASAGISSSRQDAQPSNQIPDALDIQDDDADAAAAVAEGVAELLLNS